MGSKAAGKVILQQLANNPKGAQRALSRTDDMSWVTGTATDHAIY